MPAVCLHSFLDLLSIGPEFKGYLPMLRLSLEVRGTSQKESKVLCGYVPLAKHDLFWKMAARLALKTP